MLKYNLLGQAVTFEDSAEHYYDLQFAAEKTGSEVSQQFKKWYKQCGNVQSVLDGYLQFAESVIESLVFRPLFSQLAECEIYDMDEESYWKRCIRLGESETALETVERQYNAILKQQNAEKEYRADRKAGRGHYRSYTSFHSDYWLRDQAAAGMKNLASFAGHSLMNAVGNAGSALSASMDKSALYKNSVTQDVLLNGIISDLFTAYYAHMDFLNERKENYVQSVFDEDRSSALFENAKKLPEKEHELLVQAFSLCPWNKALVKYIFIRFPPDRENICAAAQRFSIDLRDSVEDILAQEYDSDAQSSEANALVAKERILKHMREYGVSESATLDRLEIDCLQRLCEGYQEADETACEQLIEKVRQYQAQEKLKNPFFEQLQQRIEHIWTSELKQICQGLDAADEASCNLRSEKITQHKAPEDIKKPFFQKIYQRVQEIWTEELTQCCLGYETESEAICESFLSAIKAHKAPDELKTSFLQKVQARIESIWSAEDGEIFDNLYMKTDITNPNAVAEAIAYVQSKGRTNSSQKYLDALNACTPKNIENARLYHHTSRYKLYIVLAILSIIGTALLAVTWILAIPLFYMAWKMKNAWRLLTINGTMLHPALLSAPPQGQFLQKKK